MKKGYSILFATLFLFLSHSYSQLTGGRENSQKTPSASQAGTLSGGSYSGDVNIFTGEHQSSIPLGSISTPSGLNFNLELTRNSSFSFGGNESNVRGLLYGDGWNLNIPVITVATDIFHRFGNGAECNDNNTTPAQNTNLSTSDYDRSWEGDVFWFEPYISIPGVGSGRAVFKYVDATDGDCAVFSLNKFTSPVEIRFYGDSWEAITSDGTIYVFEKTIRQFMAPSNKRQHHYDNVQADYSNSDSGSKIFVDNDYVTDGDIPNIIEPKIYYNSWYCSYILHPNYYGQTIFFDYEMYGPFNFYEEFSQKNYEYVHKDIFHDRSQNYLPNYTTYRDIVLQKVRSSSVDGDFDILELEYGIDGSLGSTFLMTPGVSGAVATDPMYCSQVVETFNGNSSGWNRYPHAARNSPLNPSDVNPVNPYLNSSDNYTRESAGTHGSGFSFNHGFLESPRINNANALVAGDLYEIRTRVTRPSGTNLLNGNGTLDIAVVTNSDPSSTYSEPSSPISASTYDVTRGEQLFSTFNMAMKWQMGYGQTVLETSNLFMMPNLPSNFNGFNIQVGPGNSDIVHNYHTSDLYYTLKTPRTSTTKPNALWAYPQLKGQSSLKSAGTIQRNFGTGHPWGIMFPVYNFRALTGNNYLTGLPLSEFEKLYTGSWGMTSSDIITYGNHHNPTKFNEDVRLNQVELIRHGKTAYMLMGVKHYRMEGEYGDHITEGKKLIGQKRLKYSINTYNTRQNKRYENGNAIVSGTSNLSVILLTAVHEVPLEGDLYETDYGLSNPEVVLKTEFEYINILPSSGTYYESTPYVGLVYHALDKITDNLGGITEIEYYPINTAPTRTYSTMNFRWNCGSYSPSSYDTDKSFNMNLAVKYITKVSAQYDELTQTFTPSFQRWEYVYDLTQPTFNAKRISTPSIHFRGQNANYSDRGFAKVTVYEPALVTGERNYTIHEYFGNVNYPFSFLNMSSITDYLYYGKPKSIKKYDHQNKLHSSKDYEYAYTLAFEDGYQRPNFYREQLNRYIQPVTDNYEYRDYYCGETVSTGVYTGDEAKHVLGYRALGIGGNGAMEHPKFLPFYFNNELRASYLIRDVNGDSITNAYSSPEYLFNSYFIKLVSETDRTYEDGLSTWSFGIIAPPLDAFSSKLTIEPNPFGMGIVNPNTTVYDFVHYVYIIANTKKDVYDYLMANDSLSNGILRFTMASDLLSIDQKLNIYIHQKGLSDLLWFEIIDTVDYLPESDVLRLIYSQPYFSDTVQKRAVNARIENKELLTALLTRNQYLSDDVISYIGSVSYDWIGESYESVMNVQPRLFPDSLLTQVILDSKLGSKALVPVLQHQLPTDQHYRMIIDKSAINTMDVVDLFLNGDGIPSDTVLYYFFTERTTGADTAQLIVDRVERPLPNYLKTVIGTAFSGAIVFNEWAEIYNPLSQYCSNKIDGTRIYIETKTEYQYYEANHKGVPQNKAYELLMGMISHIDEPSTFPKKVMSHNMDSINVPVLRLKYEPSWQLFSKKVTSPHLPDAYQREEFFYLYDLQNRYARHWANYDVHDVSKYLVDVYEYADMSYDTVVYNNSLASVYNDMAELPGIPEFDGMTKSREYKMRGLVFQKTHFSKNTTAIAPVTKSEYYSYDARWQFNDLAGPSTEVQFTGDTCILTPQNPGCDGCFINTHIFGDYELGLLQQQYPLSVYCYYHLGGAVYRVCPVGIDHDLCFEEEATPICWNERFPENPENPPVNPSFMIAPGHILSKTLQLRSVSVQVDTLNYLDELDFANSKWDRKNKYIAEFSMKRHGEWVNTGLHEMYLPFTSLTTAKIQERNRHLQVKLEEDMTGLKTRYYYETPIRYHYRNKRCSTDLYVTTIYKSTALPVRITVGYERDDSLSTTYTYTNSAQVASVTDPNDLKMVYDFDGFNRLKRVREITANEDTILISKVNYQTWDRNPVDGFMARAAKNYVQKNTYNNADDTTDYSFTREYVDPLGRNAGVITSYKHPRETTQHIHHGNVVYDNWNRAYKQYKNTTNLQSAPLGESHAMPVYSFNQTAFFTEVQMEKTPKGRVRKAADFGVSINDPLNKTVRTSYAITNNIYASCELQLSYSDLIQVMSGGNTGTFRFFRAETLDQDNNKSVVYTNAFGQTIGTVSYLGTNNKVVTLFIYDNQGNVTKVINPKKQESTYEYNLLGQLFREKTPDAGEKKYMYNKRGQVSVTFDQQLWANTEAFLPAPRYRSYKYDAYGRLVEAGLIKGPEYRESHLYGPLHYKTDFYGWTEYGEAPLCVNYSPAFECSYFKNIFSHSSTQDWLARYMVTELQGMMHISPDTPVEVILSNPDYHTIVQMEKRYVYSSTEYQKGKLVQTESFNNTGQEVLRTELAYNVRGQVGAQSTYLNEWPTILEMYEITPFTISYTYNTQGVMTHQMVDDKMQYSYDHDGLGRMVQIRVRDNAGATSGSVPVVQYSYDDIEGVLSGKTHRMGGSHLTYTHFEYDARTRIKQIRSTRSWSGLMKHDYYYDQQVPAYSPGSAYGTYTPQFNMNHNGNINGVVSSYDFSDVYGNYPSLFDFPTIYGYKYDKLNRLTHADGLVGDFLVDAIPLGLIPTNSALLIGDERYIYDKIGNITSLRRTVSHSDPLEPYTVSKDEGWNYVYTSGTNRLSAVNGVYGTTSGSYTYDPNGNLETDSRRKIINTQYGRSAYPFEISAHNMVESSYLYSVDDQRIYKLLGTATDITTEFYLQDITGKTVAVRRRLNGSPPTWEYYVNGREREAKLSNLNHNGTIEKNEIEFYLYDHLGNTRIVYEPVQVWFFLNAEIKYVADYFPYGKILREYVNTNSGDAEKFLTTQHERDQETGLDYRGARFYDSDIARFLSTDPWQTKYPQWSTYNYVMGNPIMLIDPTGRGPQDIIVTTNSGQELFRLDDGKKETTTLTAKALYDKGIQWFEPLADNYMPLISKASDLTSNSSLKHFKWSDIASFSIRDWSWYNFTQKGDGDWKASSEGANGYFLVTVGGEPYWADAIGQIPYAVYAFKDALKDWGNEYKAKKYAVEKGMQFGDGSLFGKSDYSNSYDNYFILRGALWASDKYDVESSGLIYDYNIKSTKTGDYNYLKNPIPGWLSDKYLGTR